MTTTVFDALIIGGGPAGLSSALAMGRVNRTAVVFNSQSYRNNGIEHIHTVLTRDGEHPQTFRDIGKQQILEKYHGIEFVDTEIVRAAKTEVEPGYEGFQVEDPKGGVWKGRKLILGTGSRDIYPDIEGFAECWPGGIYQCLFCDGFERAAAGVNRPVGVLLLNDNIWMAGHFALQAYSFTNNVTIFSNGEKQHLSGFAEHFDPAEARGCKLEERKITRLVSLPGEEGVRIEFETGEDVTACFLAAKPSTEPSSKGLIEQLGLALQPKEKGGDVEVTAPFSESSVKGCFVPGDAGTMLKSVTFAVYSGAAATAGAHMQLCTEAGQKALAKKKSMEKK